MTIQILFPVRFKTITRPGYGYRPTAVEKKRPYDHHKHMRIERAKSAEHSYYTPEVAGRMVPATRSWDMVIAKHCNRMKESK